MPFLSPLTATLQRGKSEAGRQLWVLDEPLIYDSQLAGVITVPAGFETDYSSVPRLPLAYLLAGDTAHEAAVVHDWLYVSQHTNKQTADRVFLEAMAESGVPWWRKKIMFLAVSWFGGTEETEPGESNVIH